ncbi:hypothetical protein [Paenibacillus sacheonensis]|uniref:Uncharacterized protein n=1 Tax=Paenibacillus sacheonensis TaxID=742054 RepID=A0A7X4YL19_9BACL|nr:hypothetical protein [Paenibacillus sacheonensis]MBM7563143.1 hypothetical protein [Paenibacillus sacheonensis]NBC68293.1 hypothetical protein [Paenibacillus sacheonensis]
MSESVILSRAKDFLYGNARLLDRKRFEFHFEGGPGEDVIEVLRTYQNRDGGFGNALECDIRCPSSQPVPTEMALLIMDEIGLFDRDMIRGIASYVRDHTLPGGGIPFVYRSAAEYPHAPWWKTEADDQPAINPTGRMIGLLYKQQAYADFMDEEWFTRNVNYIWNALASETPEGYHDGVQWLSFLENTPETDRRDSHWPLLDAWLARPGVIERNPYAKGYVQKVLDWCPSPASYASKFITDDERYRHLDMLALQQQTDGGWPISWEALSPGTETEWRGWITVERLRTLRAYEII